MYIHPHCWISSVIPDQQRRQTVLVEPQVIIRDCNEFKGTDTHLLNIPQSLKRSSLNFVVSFVVSFFFFGEKSCDPESQGSRSVITTVERCQTFSARFTSPHLIHVLDMLSRGTDKPSLKI